VIPLEVRTLTAGGINDPLPHPTHSPNLGPPQLTPVDQLYSNYCTLPIISHLLHKQIISELVHTALFRTTTLPDVYHNYFVINRDVHSHDTRQRNDLLIRYVKKSFNMKSVQYSGSALWNCLPLMLKEQMSKKSFKNKVKLHLLSEMAAA